MNARTKAFAADSLDDTRFAPGDYKYLDDEGLEQPLKSFGEKTVVSIKKYRPRQHSPLQRDQFERL